MVPPKSGGAGGPGGASAARKRVNSLDRVVVRQTNTTSREWVNRGQVEGNCTGSKFMVAPLVVEGLKMGKIEFNDLLKNQLAEAKIKDIQLSKVGTFTVYCVDAGSFNKVLNDLADVLKAKGNQQAKVFVPRSIQRIKDTEKLAFVKRVDIELSEDRIILAIRDSGFLVKSVERLRSREGNMPTRTLKITFDDATNRNTFVKTGLQVDAMHFLAEAATQNSKPLQCFQCMKYNHVAKYCKASQQICAKCGGNHRLDQCIVPLEKSKCCNCEGNHIATSVECPAYREQEKRAKNLITQYSKESYIPVAAPNVANNIDFPPLPNATRPDFINEIVEVLSKKLEKITEDAFQRLVLPLHKKIEQLEKAVARLKKRDSPRTDTDSSSSEESEVMKYMRKKAEQKIQEEATASSITINSNTATKSKNIKKQTKRARSPNGNMDSPIIIAKDLKTGSNA